MTSGRCERQCPIIVTHKLCVDQPRVYRTTNCIDAVFQTLQSQVLGQDTYYKKDLKILCRTPPPSHLPSHLPDVTHARDSFSQAFPLCFCILQAIQNWRQKWPGNEASPPMSLHVMSLLLAVFSWSYRYHKLRPRPGYGAR